jgi:tetratricopeptide (TPR) repeat protein
VRLHRPEENPVAFQRMKDAYETLTDAKRRVEYDQMRRYGEQVEALTSEAVEALESDPEKSIRLLKKAVVLAPELAGTRWWLGRAYVQKEEFAEAEAEFRRLLAETPDDASLHLQVGGCLYRQDRLDEAERELRRAVELDREQFHALLLLSSLYMDREEPAKAVEVLEQAILINGTEDFTDLDVLLRLLTLYVIREDGPNAELMEKRLRNVIPNDEDAANYAMARLFDLGVDFYQAHNYVGAYEIVRRVRHTLLTDTKLKEAVERAVRHFGVCADAARIVTDDTFPKNLKTYLFWKYLDPEDEVEESVAQAAIEALRRDVAASPLRFANLVRQIRSRYHRLATEESDLLAHIAQLAAEYGRVGPGSGSPVWYPTGYGQPTRDRNIAAIAVTAIVCGIMGQIVIPVPVVGFLVGLVIGLILSAKFGFWG